MRSRARHNGRAREADRQSRCPAAVEDAGPQWRKEAAQETQTRESRRKEKGKTVDRTRKKRVRKRRTQHEQPKHGPLRGKNSAQHRQESHTNTCVPSAMRVSAAPCAQALLDHRRACGNRFAVSEGKVAGKGYYYCCPRCKGNVSSKVKLGAWTIERCVAISFTSKIGWSTLGPGVTRLPNRCVVQLPMGGCDFRTHRRRGNNAPTRLGASKTRKSRQNRRT